MSGTISRVSASERDLWAAPRWARRAVALLPFLTVVVVNDADFDDEMVHVSDAAFDDFLSGGPIPE